jgi:histone-lysine N-methyltransferase SUV39H
MYLVKWLGYASTENTWLEEDNLNCPLLLSNYKKLKAKKVRGRSEPPLASFLDICNQNTQDMDEIQTRPYFPENYIIPEPKRLFDEKTPFKDEWIKLLRNSRFNFKVTNTVDLAPPPENFTWIEESVPDVDIPDLDLNKTSGCDCGDTDCIDGNSADCQCLEARGGVSPYDKHGCVRFAPTAMAIYECNIKCACSIYCPNRVTQRIPAFTFDIFRTSNDRGWGVRAVEPIRKGKFIARVFEYLNLVFWTINYG